MPSPNPSGGPRMSRGIKLVLMGVAGAALLYSCSPGIGAGLGALPYLWFLSNPFYRPPVTAPCPPGAPNCGQQASQSSGGGEQRIGAQPRRIDDDGHQQGRAELQPARRLRRNGVVGRLIGRKLMRREASSPRPGWQQQARAAGLRLLHARGQGLLDRAGLLRLHLRRDRHAGGRDRGAARALPQGGRVCRRQQALGAHAHPAGVGRLYRAGLAARRSDDLRPLRPRLRRQGPAQAAGIQCRHADRALRGGGRAMVLAEGHEARRRPVQFHPREADRGLARHPGQAAAGGPGPLRALRGPSRGSRDVGVSARHRAAGGPRRQADRRAAGRLERPALHRSPTRCRSR